MKLEFLYFFNNLIYKINIKQYELINIHFYKIQNFLLFKSNIN